MGPEDEDFARFLEALSPDEDEGGRRYISIHKRLVGFFSVKGISDPEKAADEVIKRAGRKIRGGVDVPDVEKYCLGIARNVAKEEWRHEQRKSKLFIRFIQGLANNTAEEVEKIEHVFKPCFEQLEEEDQELLVAYCQIPGDQSHAEHRLLLAERMGKTLRSIRTRVSRLRDKLAACVEERSKGR